MLQTTKPTIGQIAKAAEAKAEAKADAAEAKAEAKAAAAEAKSDAADAKAKADAPVPEAITAEHPSVNPVPPKPNFSLSDATKSLASKS